MVSLNVTSKLLLLLSIFCIIGLSTATSPYPGLVSKQDACNFWRNFSTEMNDFNKRYRQISYNCTYDPNKCTGADCTGAIRIEFPGISAINTHFCFGLQINHCDHPISMDIYYVNGVNSLSYKVLHNSSIKLSNLEMHTSLGTLTPFLFFYLTKPVPHHVLFGVRAKVRQTTKLFGSSIEEWPSYLQQDIIPNTEIPVTPCIGPASTTIAPTLTPKKCVNHTFPTPATTPSSPVVTKSTNQNTNVTPMTRFPPTTTMAIHSPTYNKPCDMNSFKHSCSMNEKCVESAKDSSKGICKCQEKHPFNRMTGLCHGSKVVPTFHWGLGLATTTVRTVVNNQPHKGNQSNQSKSISKGAMIGGIVGGVVFLVVVLVIVVLLWRRNRNNSQYIGRLLLNDDDTDNVI